MGFFSWLGSGPKNIKKYSSKVLATDEIRDGGRYIGDLVKGLGAKDGRSETFENAYNRLGLTEDKLQETYKFYMDRFLLFSFFFGLGIIAFVYFLFGSILSAMACLGFLAICLSQLFNSSFRMFQIRRRELCSVGVWLSNSSEWWPKALGLKKSKSTSIRSVVSDKKRSNTLKK